MGRCWASGLACVSLAFPSLPPVFVMVSAGINRAREDFEANFGTENNTGVLDREGNARKVVNCSCVVIRDWGEESQERAFLMNYFATERRG